MRGPAQMAVQVSFSERDCPTLRRLATNFGQRTPAAEARRTERPFASWSSSLTRSPFSRNPVVVGQTWEGTSRHCARKERSLPMSGSSTDPFQRRRSHTSSARLLRSPNPSLTSSQVRARSRHPGKWAISWWAMRQGQAELR